MSKLLELAKKAKALKKEIHEQGKKLVKESFIDFFQKHPEVDSIVWAQYTPYFNDGDACIFDMNGWDCHVSLESLRQLEVPESVIETFKDEDGYHYGYGGILHHLENQKLNNDKVSSLIKDFEELESGCSALKDMMQDAFGDHVLIKATKEGFEIDDYDHD